MEVGTKNTELKESIEFAIENASDELFLSQLNLTELDADLTGLDAVKSIYLFGNNFTVFPEALCKLTQLERIYISGNQIAVIPESIANLTQLKLLDIKNNKLSSLPKAIAALKRLEVLYLSENELKTLPEELFQCVQLKKLDLKDNQLEILPDQFHRLPNLKQLDLSNNALTQLASSISKLQSLEKLHVLNNQLSSLPHSFLELINLNSNEQKYQWEQGLRLSGNTFAIPEASLIKEPIELIQEIVGANGLEIANREPLQVKQTEKVIAPDATIDPPPVKRAPKKSEPEIKEEATTFVKNDAPISSAISIAAFGKTEYAVQDFLENVFQFSEDRNSISYVINSINQDFGFQNYGFLPIKEVRSKLLQLPRGINVLLVDTVQELHQIKKVNNKSRTLALVQGDVPNHLSFEFPVVGVNDTIKCSQIIEKHLSAFVRSIHNEQVESGAMVLIDVLTAKSNMFMSVQEFEKEADSVGLRNKLEKKFALKYLTSRGYIYHNSDNMLLSDKLFVNKVCLHQELSNVFNSVLLAKQNGVITSNQFPKVVGSSYNEPMHNTLLSLLVSQGWCKKKKDETFSFVGFDAAPKKEKVAIAVPVKPVIDPPKVNDLSAVKQDMEATRAAAVEQQEFISKEIEKAVAAAMEKANKSNASNTTQEQADTANSGGVMKYLPWIISSLCLAMLAYMLYSNNAQQNTVAASEETSVIEGGANVVLNEDLPTASIENQPFGYYAIVETYVTLQNAQRMENELFAAGEDSYIFDMENGEFRVAVFLSNNVYDSKSKFQYFTEAYPSAWLMHNN